MDPVLFSALVASCAPLVHANTVHAMVAVESSFNPHAIGVVGGVLPRQPRTPGEARATANALHRDGWNYSVGLAQINRQNFQRLGLTLDSAFEPCQNLRAMQTVLVECAERAVLRTPATGAMGPALSCYYSGNFVTGFRYGYVDRVVSTARRRSAPASRPP